MSVLYGVLVGILTSIVIYIGRYSVGQVLVVLCRVRNISGTWSTEFAKDGKSQSETAKVKQLFSKVWGIIEYKKDGQLRKYKMRGSLKESILSATYEIVSPKEPLDRGSFTLRLSMDGSKMNGYYAWTDDESRDPKGDKYVWTRIQD